MNKLAFPVDMDDGSGRVVDHGMTLRDYFAAKAMAAMMMSPLRQLAEEANEDTSKCARWAYEQADAMMRAREKYGDEMAIPTGLKLDSVYG